MPVEGARVSHPGVSQSAQDGRRHQDVDGQMTDRVQSHIHRGEQQKQFAGQHSPRRKRHRQQAGQDHRERRPVLGLVEIRRKPFCNVALHGRRTQRSPGIPKHFAAVRIQGNQRERDPENRSQPPDPRPRPHPGLKAEGRIQGMPNQEEAHQANSGGISGVQVHPQQHERRDPPQEIRALGRKITARGILISRAVLPGRPVFLSRVVLQGRIKDEQKHANEQEGKGLRPHAPQWYRSHPGPDRGHRGNRGTPRTTQKHQQESGGGDGREGDD